MMDMMHLMTPAVADEITKQMNHQAEEDVRLLQVIDRKFREARYPHPYTIDPITGVRRSCQR